MPGTAVSLVLNATYEPLCVVPVRRAAVLVLTDKAVPVTEGDGLLRSTTTVVVAPAVVRLTRFVKVPFRGQVSLTRRAVFARDAGRCAYCTLSANTIDHVIPRSQGGTSTWENCVLACIDCNKRKADRTPRQAGMKLRTTPVRPMWQPFYARDNRRIESWSKFISETYWNVSLEA